MTQKRKWEDTLDDLVSFDPDIPPIPNWQMIGILFLNDPDALKEFAEKKRKARKENLQP